MCCSQAFQHWAASACPARTQRARVHTRRRHVARPATSLSRVRTDSTPVPVSLLSTDMKIGVASLGGDLRSNETPFSHLSVWDSTKLSTRTAPASHEAPQTRSVDLVRRAVQDIAITVHDHLYMLYIHICYIYIYLYICILYICMYVLHRYR